MSAARVLNPVVLSEFCKLRPNPSTVSNLSCVGPLDHIRRDLFGPVNRAEIQKFTMEQLDKHHETAAKRWGFDFLNGVPLQGHSRFTWEPLSYQETVNTPQMYTLTRAAHVRPVVEPPSALDLLIDERAERENFMSSATDTDSCDESQDEATVTFKVPTIVGHSNKTTKITLTSRKPNLRKRQPKITEYMKERKRLPQTPKKISPPTKRMRTSSGSGVSSTANSHLSQMFGFGGNISFKRYAK